MRLPFYIPYLSSQVVGGAALSALVVGVLLWILYAPVAGTDAPERYHEPAPTAEWSAPAAELLGIDLPRVPQASLPGSTTERSPTPLLPFRHGFDASSLALSYDDPTGSDIPLTWVADRRDRWLTPGFRVADFAARDGAPLARISPRLVDALERVRRRAGDLKILSGYRHPSHNDLVGGVEHSRHQAGVAADIVAEGIEPLDLALLAVDEAGCGLGLGLGSQSLHVDVRGELMTWTYPDAPLDASAFDVLIRTRCGLPVSDSLAQRAREAGIGLDVLEALEAETDSTALAEGTDLDDHVGDLRAYAARLGLSDGPGAVVLDLRSFSLRTEPYFLPHGDPEIEDLGLSSLVEFAATRQTAGYVAYAILLDGRAPHRGITSVRPEGIDDDRLKASR